MIKNKIKCEYCVPEKWLALSGATTHYRSKHPAHFEEFKSRWEEIKKTAIKTGESPKMNEIKPEDKKDNEVKTPEVKKDEIKEPKIVLEPENFKQEDKGEKKPPKAKSFLTSFNDWLDSDKF